MYYLMVKNHLVSCAVLGYEMFCLLFQPTPFLLTKQKSSQFNGPWVHATRWEIQRANPLSFLLSSLEAFLRSYGTQYVEPSSSLDRQGGLQNKLCRHASQTMLSFAFDKEMCRYNRYNKWNQVHFDIYFY